LRQQPRRPLQHSQPSRAGARFPHAELLRRVADALEERRTDVCGVAERETGLDSDRLQGELTRTTGQLAAFAGLADSGAWLDPILDRADPQATPPKPDQRRMNVAVGPVAVYHREQLPVRVRCRRW